jgi:ABC-type multidrug transport system ATPase subunit
MRAVDGVSLELIAGEIAAVLGSHGAGKTTLVRALAGRLPLEAGTVRVAGHPAGSRAARRLAGVALEGAVFPPGLSVRDVIEYLARLHDPGPAHRQQVGRVLELAGLEAESARSAGVLPPGLKSRLAFAQAALGSRAVVLLDEPFAGVDARGRAELAGAMRRLAGEGVALLLATRDPAALEHVATRALLLHHGRIVGAGAPSVLAGGRVLELVLDRPPAEAPPGFRITAAGLETELRGTTPEAALALCRAYRLEVRASRVREPSLEDAVARITATR